MAVELAVILERYQSELERIARDAPDELTTRVITRTPVDTSALRLSWTSNNGDPVAINRDGNDARHDHAAVINSLNIGDKYSLANGQPYARRIEYEGWSQQAPQGMLRVSVAEWQQIADRAARNGR